MDPYHPNMVYRGMRSLFVALEQRRATSQDLPSHGEVVVEERWARDR